MALYEVVVVKEPFRTRSERLSTMSSLRKSKIDALQSSSVIAVGAQHSSRVKHSNVARVGRCKLESKLLKRLSGEYLSAPGLSVRAADLLGTTFTD
jgi:hypothetical protein